MFEFMEQKDYNMGIKKNKISKHCDDRKKKKYSYRVKRPIDQKCTIDVITCVAASIEKFTDEDNDRVFCVNDIWFSDYACNYVIKYFQKPDPRTKTPSEYDKFFSQPINLLEYTGVIKFVGRKNGFGKNNFFKVVERDVIHYLALSAQNSMEFLEKFVTKLLVDCRLDKYFDDFFEKQDNASYKTLRKKFYDYMDKKTNINNDNEKGRIFTKVINVLAVSKGKKGSIKGHMSKKKITFSELLYNRENWRFFNTKKEKDMTRQEFMELLEQEKSFINEMNIEYSDTAMKKAKDRLKKYNELYRQGKPEVMIEARNDRAKEAHHIFPQSEFKSIRACVENLIMLTAYQHDDLAHEDDKRYIKKDFQRKCIIEKINRIKESFDYEENDFYSFDKLLLVLNTGLKTDKFSKVKPNDFEKIVQILNQFDWME